MMKIQRKRNGTQHTKKMKKEENKRKIERERQLVPKATTNKEEQQCAHMGHRLLISSPDGLLRRFRYEREKTVKPHRKQLARRCEINHLRKRSEGEKVRKRRERGQLSEATPKKKRRVAQDNRQSSRWRESEAQRGNKQRMKQIIDKKTTETQQPKNTNTHIKKKSHHDTLTTKK
eukprot:GCRY01005020.1.p1 GENE.GCRY01005020.1~~GCRY01005020.1.p1  ORF type:complete len:175 (+),score=18.50 GCRY01005020.1:304-828(+)